jgi:hypothetical protein
MSHATVPAGEPPEEAQPHRAHPLVASVATVDRAVTLLSFRILVEGIPPAEPAIGPPPAEPAIRPLPAPSSPRRAAPWIACDHALSDPDFFPQWRAKVAERLAELHPPALGKTHVPEKTTGGYVLQWYLIIPSYLGALLFHSARRVPTLSPWQLSFRLELGALQEVALRPGRFWCLPGDPDADHPDAMPVPDEAVLGAILRRQVTAHASRFLSVYDTQVRFGHRTQWAAVTDMLDSGLLLAGRSFGSPQAGAADARLVLADGAKPLTSASTICEVTDDYGRTHWTRRRGSCCFLYALPGVERPCVGCPRINDRERTRIFGARESA